MPSPLLTRCRNCRLGLSISLLEMSVEKEILRFCMLGLSHGQYPNVKPITNDYTTYLKLKGKARNLGGMQEPLCSPMWPAEPPHHPTLPLPSQPNRIRIFTLTWPSPQVMQLLTELEDPWLQVIWLLIFCPTSPLENTLPVSNMPRKMAYETGLMTVPFLTAYGYTSLFPAPKIVLHVSSF